MRLRAAAFSFAMRSVYATKIADSKPAQTPGLSAKMLRRALIRTTICNIPAAKFPLAHFSPGFMLAYIARICAAAFARLSGLFE
jgi:hypothetical protein